MSDHRRGEADTERTTIIDDKWIEDHFIIMTNIYITLIQAEVDRYAKTRQLIVDYFKDSHSSVSFFPLCYRKFIYNVINQTFCLKFL